MLPPAMVVGLASSGYLAYLFGEWRRHQRQLRRIPLRIHVNGTRGKSTVTRLIAACLRAHGLRTIAKTTGTTPRIIFPDGSEKAIVRRAGPNIIEQVHAVAFAAQQAADALVVECMAVQPEYQWVSEQTIIRSQIGVITNARLDHTDVMGPTLQTIGNCLANTIPRSGTLITAEHVMLPVLRTRAIKMGSQVVAVDPDDITPDELAGFTYPSFAENIAVALAVCRALGIDRATAMAGMQAAAPDPGTLRSCHCRMEDKDLIFVNGLAANDTMSTRQIWDRMAPDPTERTRVLLYCSRSDRPARNAEFVHAIANDWEAERYLLIGPGAGVMARHLVARGVRPDRLVHIDGTDPAIIAQEIIAVLPPESWVFASGNIIGLGEALVDFFFSRGHSGYICADSIAGPVHFAHLC